MTSSKNQGFRANLELFKNRDFAILSPHVTLATLKQAQRRSELRCRLEGAGVRAMRPTREAVPRPGSREPRSRRLVRPADDAVRGADTGADARAGSGVDE